MPAIEGRDSLHWTSETYAQRMRDSEWRRILLEYDDSIIVKGRRRQLVAKNLGYGVVEITKKSIVEE